jgi:tetratricopeptide (TPR) repeat protein
MKLRRYLVLAGILSILNLTNPVCGQAGWLDDLADKFNDWMEDFKHKRDIRYTYPQFCKKYFESGDLNQAYNYCLLAKDYDKDFIYQAAVVQYLYRVEKETDAKTKSRNIKNAIISLQEAEKYLLEKLESGGGDEQSKIETKKKLANVYLWLSCAYADYYREIEDDDTANWGREALKTAREYFDKAIALTDEAEGYIIVIAGIKLSWIYLENASSAYKWLLEAEAVLGKTLEASEKMKRATLFPKKEIESAKMQVYNLRGGLASKRIEYKKDVEQEFEKGKEFYLKAIEIAKKIDQIQDLPTLIHNLAILHKVKGEYDEYEKLAKEAIEQARKIAKLGGPGGIMNKERMARWYEKLADFYLKQRDDKERAKECLKAALKAYSDLRLEFKYKDALKFAEYDRKTGKVSAEIRRIDKMSDKINQ